MAESRTNSANQALEHYYNGALVATKQTVFTGRGNIFAFECENNDATNDVFLQVFDKLAASVTVGTTVPDFTFRIPAGANFGKDAQNLVLHFCSIGCVIAATTTRTGSSAPTALSVNLWYWNHV